MYLTHDASTRNVTKDHPMPEDMLVPKPLKWSMEIINVKGINPNFKNMSDSPLTH